MMPALTNTPKPIVLPPMLFAPVGYYAIMADSPEVAIDWSLRADKRFKAAHRYEIADTQGQLSLTVPVCHLSGNRSWDDVEISSHDQWWLKHRISLESAYGRTPYFEFYIDRFLPLIDDPEVMPFKTIGALCRQADQLVRDILDLPQPLAADQIGGIDKPASFNFQQPTRPYWQVRCSKFGFLSGLSILDLIFNQGPESVDYL